MTRPVILVVDDDPAALARVGGELTKRYGTDYEVLAHGVPTPPWRTCSGCVWRRGPSPSCSPICG